MNKKLNYNINILNKNCITTWLYPKSSTSIFLLDKLQLTHIWFGRNLSCLSVVWNLILYPLEVWLKFKLSHTGLKSYNAIIPLDFFLSYIFMFLEKKCIKVK